MTGQSEQTGQLRKLQKLIDSLTSLPTHSLRDHGGGIDAACARWGGARRDWIDLSTGINPIAYPLPEFECEDWAALPDRGAFVALEHAARAFWGVPEALDVLPLPGASSAIARLPGLARSGCVNIPGPTYNEHEAAFRAGGWKIVPDPAAADATVLVNPNNPDGRYWGGGDLPERGLLVMDESFCDIAPEKSLLDVASKRPDTLILKSFGKFWGLAGLRLGFVIGAPEYVAHLREMAGPWAVSGPALKVGSIALSDLAWAGKTRQRLARDAARLDTLAMQTGASLVGGTPLFRLYDVENAGPWQERLARAQIWTRRFPYSTRWIRLGLPGRPEHWNRLAEALA